MENNIHLNIPIAIQNNNANNTQNNNSPSFAEENPREFNSYRLSDTLKCEEIINNGLEILIHLVILSGIVLNYLLIRFDIIYFFAALITYEMLSFLVFLYRSYKKRISLLKHVLFAEFLNLFFITVHFLVLF